MSRRPARCTIADIRRAVEGAKAAGVRMSVDILPDGTIRLIPMEAVQEPRNGVRLEPRPLS